MGKTKRATRKELEEVVVKLIEEVQYLRQGFTALDNYVGAYVRYKGDTIQFTESLKKEFKKYQEKPKKSSNDTKKSLKSDKEERYKKVSTPPL